MKKIHILFVCLGNICRSPIAEVLMRDLIAQVGMSERITTDSAGTSGWHDGKGMHCGSAETLEVNGIDPGRFISKRLPENALNTYDYIVVMDDDNLHEVEQRFGRHPRRIFKLTDFSREYDHVPDPYYTRRFQHSYDIIAQSCRAWLPELIKEINA
ncbi:MAG: low molecular weight protein-tyrosine-phosphatase [Neisseria sp.]|nr:low molecular weight protein-tyrosine-phosphatase [Neisseria sp.]